ncbi:acyl-CoA dehydrogenase family protein [Mycolicibacterium novocastrense]|nr:acyl-CoA dehydrogenase family protein [Mycolicibacterium novocastrense]
MDVFAGSGRTRHGRDLLPRRRRRGGLRRLDGVRIFEQLAIADPVTAAFLSIHNMCAWMIDSFGTDEQRKDWIPRLATMGVIASYCLTGTGRRIDAGALSTRAVRHWLRKRRRLRARWRQTVRLRGPQHRTCMW